MHSSSVLDNGVWGVNESPSCAASPWFSQQIPSVLNCIVVAHRVVEYVKVVVTLVTVVMVGMVTVVIVVVSDDVVVVVGQSFT